MTPKTSSEERVARQPLNVELLLKIKSHILAEPRRLMMGSFISRKSADYPLVHDASAHALIERDYAPCGTAACIAGWAVLLTDGMGVTLRNDIRYRAANLIGISRQNFEEDQLFEVSEWPIQFSERYREATDVQTLAQVTADRIDFFIATKGTDKP